MRTLLNVKFKEYNWVEPDTIEVVVDDNRVYVKLEKERSNGNISWAFAEVKSHGLATTKDYTPSISELIGQVKDESQR
jgi:hypothetical protein